MQKVLLVFLILRFLGKHQVKIRHFRDEEMLSYDYEERDSHLFHLKVKSDLFHLKGNIRAVNNLGEHRTFVR